MVLQLEKGMTDAQVQFLLGVPLVRDQFHADRWDYVYFLMRGDGERQLRKLHGFLTTKTAVSTIGYRIPCPTKNKPTN